MRFIERGEPVEKKKRYTVLDMLRGISVLSMIVYHTLWDLVYIHGVDIPWFFTSGASVFQAYIRWSFIIISGFSFSLGKKKLKRSLVVIASSVIITLVTLIAMPDSRIIFGVLTFMGVAMLLTVPLDRVLSKVEPWTGFFVNALLFSLTLGMSYGYVGIGLFSIDIPLSFYSNYFTAFLGFPHESFYSSDYVPLFPWIFLFICGYFLYKIFKKHDLFFLLSFVSFKPLEWIGKHALIIYMLHQPLIYGALYLIFNIALK
jgi:uncharacterized membrane protein